MAQELAKATITPLDGRRRGDEIKVLFNPTEYSVDYSATFQETAPPGLSNPIIQFVNGNAQRLNMDLLFDTYTDGRGQNVLELTSPITELVSIDGLIHAPPRVRFRWGQYEFVAVVEQVSQRLTMFLPDGTPVRAKLSVKFKQYRTVAEQLQDPRRNSADKTKRRVFGSDDRVDLLAAREYGEPRFWRLIARNNDIDDPRQIEAGRVLVLPPIEADEREGRGDGHR
jgi:nucleoid-associated protein YgaU